MTKRPNPDPFKDVLLQCPECGYLHPFRNIIKRNTWVAEKEQYCEHPKDMTVGCGNFSELSSWNWKIMVNGKLKDAPFGYKQTEFFKIIKR